jgi:hypothetical protein
LKTFEDKTTHFYRFPTFQMDKRHRGPEILIGHNLVSAMELAHYHDIGGNIRLDYSREAHRRDVSEQLMNAMYEGWMPFNMEWWEGLDDDRQLLQMHREVPYDHGAYHFWTRIELATMEYPLHRRDESMADSGYDVTFDRYSPPNLATAKEAKR